MTKIGAWVPVDQVEKVKQITAEDFSTSLRIVIQLGIAEAERLKAAGNLVA